MSAIILSKPLSISLVATTSSSSSSSKEVSTIVKARRHSIVSKWLDLKLSCSRKISMKSWFSWSTMLFNYSSFKTPNFKAFFIVIIAVYGTISVPDLMKINKSKVVNFYCSRFLMSSYWRMFETRSPRRSEIFDVKVDAPSLDRNVMRWSRTWYTSIKSSKH